MSVRVNGVYEQAANRYSPVSIAVKAAVGCACFLPLISAQAETKPRDVEEVIVTAQKRSEKLQEVPVPVTVVSAENLATTNQLRIQDYYTRVPGLNLTMLGDVGQAS